MVEEIHRIGGEDIMRNIEECKPDLIDCICIALRKANPEIYANSMQSLVYKDIVSALEQISTAGIISL